MTALHVALKPLRFVQQLLWKLTVIVLPELVIGLGFRKVHSIHRFIIIIYTKPVFTVYQDELIDPSLTAPTISLTERPMGDQNIVTDTVAAVINIHTLKGQNNLACRNLQLPCLILIVVGNIITYIDYNTLSSWFG